MLPACHFLNVAGPGEDDAAADESVVRDIDGTLHACHFLNAAGPGEDDPAADESAEQGVHDTLHASTKARDSSSSFKGKGKGPKGKGAKGKGAKGPGKGSKGQGDKAGRAKRGRDAANLNKLKTDFPGLNIMDFENMDMDALKAQLDEMQASRDKGAALTCFCLTVVIRRVDRQALKPTGAHDVSAAHWRLQVTKDMMSSSL